MHHSHKKGINKSPSSISHWDGNLLFTALLSLAQARRGLISTSQLQTPLHWLLHVDWASRSRSITGVRLIIQKHLTWLTVCSDRSKTIRGIQRGGLSIIDWKNGFELTTCKCIKRYCPVRLCLVCLFQVILVRFRLFQTDLIHGHHYLIWLFWERRFTIQGRGRDNGEEFDPNPGGNGMGPG